VVCAALLIGRRPLTRRHWLALAAGAAIAAVAVLPVGIAYLGARAVVGERSAEEVARGSATPLNYLGPPEFNLIYGTALKPFAAGERRLFPGFVAIGLALAAFVGTRPRSRAETTWLIAYGLGLLVAFDLSLGFNGISYRILYEYVLPFRGLRVPARMGIIVGFSLAVLAGFATAALIRRFGRGIAVVAALLMLLEYASKPLDLRQIPTAPPESYADAIKDSGDSPTATLFEFPATPFDDPTYMYYSTFHWQNLVNGYSGFFPPSYNRVVNGLKNFPDQTSFDAIKSRAPRYLLVHGERLFGARYEEVSVELGRRSDLRLISRRPAVGPAGHSEVSLYRISYSDLR